jgi:hypothetical protein
MGLKGAKHAKRGFEGPKEAKKANGSKMVPKVVNWAEKGTNGAKGE